MPEETNNNNNNAQPPALHEKFLEWVGEKINRFLNPPPVVVILRLSGIIMAASPRYQNAISLKSMEESIEKAFSFTNAKAVALVVNSPGGSPVQSALIAKRIRDFSKEKEIPVFAFVEDVAASGGYWLACAGEEIYANESSIVGSIGVISAGFGFQEAIEKLGIERRVHTSGEKKSILDPFRPERAEDVEILQRIQKELHENFIAYVTDRRGGKLKSAETNLFSGEFWTGIKGKELGLVDDIGELREVMKTKFGEDIEFKHLHKPRSWLEKRLPVLDRMSSTNLAEDLLEAAEAKAVWQRFGL